MGKVIHWELCKKFKFDHTAKWYKHKPESVLVNEMHKIIWGFEIQTDPIITASRLDLVVNNKKENFAYSGLYRHSGPQNENQRKQKERQVLRPCQRTEKVVENEGDSNPNCIWRTWNDPQRRMEGLKIGGRIETIKTTTLLRSARIIRDLRRFAVTQIPVKDHQLTLE